MPDVFVCPRRSENFGFVPSASEDRWRENDTCSYCGSMNPDSLFPYLSPGFVKLIPTDKNYKAYVEINDVEEPDWFQTPGPDYEDWWTRRNNWYMEHRPIREGKLYFQHLSIAQKAEFISLVNRKEIRFGHPGYFYVLPFFCSRRYSLEDLPETKPSSALPELTHEETFPKPGEEI
jgi:hypothetical protein